MNIFRIVKLKFTSPLHLGKGVGDAYDTSERLLHSDTLSGAVVSTLLLTNPAADAPEFMAKYRISSAFPYMGTSFFLPKPAVRSSIRIDDSDDYGQKKKVKKIEYIESSLWQDLVKGNELNISSGMLSKNGKFLFCDKAPKELPYTDLVQQRVLVPRAGGDSKPYYLERRYFHEDAGLYFFLNTDAETADQILALLNILGDTGLGTDKSVGNGQFECGLSELELNLPEDTGKSMLLSLACPLKEETDSDMLRKSSYQLVQRGGFISGTSRDEFRHLRKKSIYMFTEGSVISRGKLEGKIENLRPEWNDHLLHPVWRDGRAFVVPVNL